MRKILLVIITLIFTFTNVNSQSTEKVLSKNDFKKIKSITKELKKLHSKRYETAKYFVIKANENGAELKIPDKVDNLILFNDFQKDSLKIDKYFKYQRKFSGLIVTSILSLEKANNLENDKEFNKYLDKLTRIEENLKIISKKYNKLIDENKSFKSYPRVGGTKKSEIDFDINFD